MDISTFKNELLLIKWFNDPQDNKDKCHVIFKTLGTFISEVKPTLGFDFTFLHFEPNMGFLEYYNNDNKYKMNQFHIDECYKFLESFIKDAPIEVYAYDPTDDFIYKGKITNKEAIFLGYKYSLNAPESIVSKFNSVTDSWDVIYGIIMEDGSYILNPESICDKCVMFLSKEEWDRLPPIPSINPWIYIWDFATSTWKDGRDFNNHLTTAISEICIMCNDKKNALYNRTITDHELSSWNMEVEESKYIINQYEKNEYISIENIPFLHACMSVTNPSYSQFELYQYAKSVIINNTNYRVNAGTIHGKMRQYISKLNACKNNAEIDQMLTNARSELV